jgi:dCTP deaminase
MMRIGINMTLLSYNRLVQLVEDGVITNVKPEQINGSSIDITLGNLILREAELVFKQDVLLKERQKLVMEEYDLRRSIYALEPNEFILAHSQQVFNLPDNISAEYKLKSSMARIGLEHLNAGWCDALWNGSVLTLELKNMTRKHCIILEEGVAIGQMVFFEHEPVPLDKSYATRGRYNNDKTVSGIKV